MRNLKKVLSLVLALAMVLSLCMVGAGAVNYDDFTDEGTITKKQAVETLVSLDVIQGYDGGATFNPTGNVTRAEMATMICRILAGGDNMIVDATKPVATYADIAGHWAESYIEYCSSLGIVSGKSPTSFDPQANVTAAEATKMVMTTLGYNADIEGFKGIGWDINTMAKANTLKLLDNLQGEISASVPVTREQVAQLLFNALDDPMVQNYVGTSANLWIGSGANAYQQTLLESKFNAQKVVGVVEANEFADLYDTEPLGRGKTRIMVLGTDNQPTSQKYTLNLSTTLDQIGESIIVYRDTTSNRILFGNDQASDMNVVSEFTAKGDITKSGDFENAISKDALTKSTEYFVNYDVNDVTEADIRIRFDVDLAELQTLNDNERDEPYASLLARLRADTANVSGNSYSKTIRDGAKLTSLDIETIKTIFDVADTKIKVEGEDKEVVFDIGAVYVGTQSRDDISDKISYEKFEEEYLIIKQDMSKVTENENGNYIKAIDYNNDGEIDFVLKTIYTATEVTKVAKDGKITLATEDYALTDRKDGFEILNQLDDRTDIVSDDELAKGDVVLYTVIDGTAYAYLADSVTADIDKVNRNTLTATTVDGDEYVESGVHNHTYNDLYEDGVRNLGGKISYDLYFDRYGYVVLFTENVSSSFTLITDGWYNEIKANKDVEYAVEAWVDGKLQVVDVTKGGNLFITGDYVDNNGWGALKKFGGLVNKYDADGNKIVDASDPRNAHTDLNFDTIDVNDTDQTEANNLWTTVADLDSNGVLTPVGNVYTKRTVEMIDLDTNILSNRIATGYLYDSNTRGDAYTQRTVSSTNLDPADPVEVRALSTTVYYYVWRNGKTPIVREYVGYGNVPKLSNNDIVEDVYAVATLATRDSDETRPDTYYTANVVVVEFKSEYKTSAEIVFVYDAPVVSGRVGTEELNVIKPDGSLGTILADLSNMRDYSPALGKVVDPGLFRIWETNKERDGEKIYEIEPLTAQEIADAKFVVGTVNTEKVVGDTDWVGLTTWQKDGPGKDTTVGINKNDVKDADNIKTYYGLTNEDPDVEKRNTENSKYYTLDIEDDGTGWNNGHDRYKVTLGGERDALDREEVLMEHVREGRYTDLLNTVLVSYDKDNNIVYAISFAHLDGSARNAAQDIWAGMLTSYTADTSIDPQDAIDGLAKFVKDVADNTISGTGDTEIPEELADWKLALENALNTDGALKGTDQVLDAMALVGRDDVSDPAAPVPVDGLVHMAEAILEGDDAIDEYVAAVYEFLGLTPPAAGASVFSARVADPDDIEAAAEAAKVALRVALAGAVTGTAADGYDIDSSVFDADYEDTLAAMVTKPAAADAEADDWTGTALQPIALAGMLKVLNTFAEAAELDLTDEINAVKTAVETAYDGDEGTDAGAILNLYQLNTEGETPVLVDTGVKADVNVKDDPAVSELEEAINSASIYTVSTGTLSNATGLTFKAGNTTLAASTPEALIQETATLTINVANASGAEVTYKLTATMAGQEDISFQKTIADGENADFVFEFTAAGEWTITGEKVAAATNVTITANGATLRVDGGLVTDANKVFSKNPGETVVVTFDLGDYQWAPVSELNVTVTGGEIDAQPTGTKGTITFTKDNTGNPGTIVFNVELSLEKAIEAAQQAVTDAGETAKEKLPAASADAIDEVVTAQNETIGQVSVAGNVAAAQTAAIKAVDDKVIELVKAMVDGKEVTVQDKTTDTDGSAALAAAKALLTEGTDDSLLTVETGTTVGDDGTTYTCVIAINYGTGDEDTATVTVKSANE